MNKLLKNKKIKNIEKHSSAPKKEIPSRSGWFLPWKKWPFLWLILIIVPLAIYFHFSLNHLDQFETADEHLWISDFYTGRIQKYWDAMQSRNWEQTRVNDKPGITLAYISGIGTWFETNVESKLNEKENLWAIYNIKKQQETFLLYRKPIVIFVGIFSLFYLIAFWRLTKNEWLSLAATSAILISPTIVGMSQIINPDSMLWIFSFAAVLSFLIFLKENRFIDFFLSALFLGLALLSKYVALIFIPFFMAMLLAYLFFQYPELEENKKFRKKAIFISLGFPLIVVGGITLFALGMPALWVNFEKLQDAIFQFKSMRDIFDICFGISIFILVDALVLKSAITRFILKYLQYAKPILPRLVFLTAFIFAALAVSNWAEWPKSGGFLSIADFGTGGTRSKEFDQLPLWQKFFLEAKPLLFSLTPATIFLMMFAWIKSIFRRSKFEYLILIFTAFLPVFFYAVMEQKLLVNVRYSIVLYPFVFALAGIGFYEIAKNLKFYFSAPLFLLFVYLNFSSLKSIQPFYFNYANSLLPKESAISKAWGYGGYEAVNYINSQGNPYVMKIWTDYYGVCPFFAGKCVMEGSVKWMKDSEVANIDYVISSSQGINKNAPGMRKINEIFPTEMPVWELNIGDRQKNFVKVYKNPLKK